MENINLQLNNSTCIQSTQDLMGTNYYNVCTGDKQFVMYGTLDIFAGLLGLVLLSGLAIGLWKMLNETFR